VRRRDVTNILPPRCFIIEKPALIAQLCPASTIAAIFINDIRHPTLSCAADFQICAGTDGTDILRERAHARRGADPRRSGRSGAKPRRGRAAQRAEASVDLLFDIVDRVYHHFFARRAARTRTDVRDVEHIKPLSWRAAMARYAARRRVCSAGAQLPVTLVRAYARSQSTLRVDGACRPVHAARKHAEAPRRASCRARSLPPLMLIFC